MMIERILVCLAPVFTMQKLVLLLLVGRPENEGGIIFYIKRKYVLSWGTVRNYILALSDFINYLDTHPDLLGLDLCDDRFIRNVKCVQQKCLASASKEWSEETMTKKAQQIGTYITGDEIASFLSSDQVAETFAFFRGFKSMTAVRPDLYAKHLSVLMLVVQLTNGKRAGVISDMTVDEVLQAKEQDGVYVCMVSSSKTYRIYGPSRVIFNAELYTVMQSLVTKVRFALGLGSTVPNAFVTFKGTPVANNDVSKFLREAWQAFSTKSISCNIIRKSLVSISRENPLINRDQQTELAKHMDHSLETADRHYNIGMNIQTSVRAARLIVSLYRSEPDEGMSMYYLSEINSM